MLQSTHQTFAPKIICSQNKSRQVILVTYLRAVGRIFIDLMERDIDKRFGHADRCKGAAIYDGS